MRVRARTHARARVACQVFGSESEWAGSHIPPAITDLPAPDGWAGARAARPDGSREPNRRPPPERSREERTQLQSSSFLISGSVTEAQLITQPKLNGDESCYAFIYCRRPNGPTLW